MKTDTDKENRSQCSLFPERGVQKVLTDPGLPGIAEYKPFKRAPWKKNIFFKYSGAPVVLHESWEAALEQSFLGMNWESSKNPRTLQRQVPYSLFKRKVNPRGWQWKGAVEEAS